jgi:hypothetical protein
MSAWWLLLIIPASASFGAVAMGWICGGKIQRKQQDCDALEEQLATERRRTAAFIGEVRSLDTKLYQLNNKPSMGE